MKKGLCLLFALLLMLSACSPAPGPNPVVTITMDDGSVIKAELYPGKAPNTVANFVTLAQSGYYDGLVFHRTSPSFMIQGGDPAGTGSGPGPGYSIKGEFPENGHKQNDLSHTRGVLSMARTTRPDSAGSQFFIVVQDSEFLDGKYAAFGRVIEGMDAADSIASGPNTGPALAPGEPDYMALEPRTMISVTVETFDVTYAVKKN